MKEVLEIYNTMLDTEDQRRREGRQDPHQSLLAVGPDSGQFIHILPGYLLPDEANQGRITQLVEKLRALARLA